MIIHHDLSPVWEPLKKAVGIDNCSRFMYMGKVAVGEFWVFLYKHITTRRYLNLDGLGNAYEYIHSERAYRFIKLPAALNYVFSWN